MWEFLTSWRLCFGVRYVGLLQGTGHRHPWCSYFKEMVPVSLEKTSLGCRTSKRFIFYKGLHTSQSTRENIYSFRFFKGNTKEGVFFPFWHQGKFKFFKVCIYPCPTHFTEEKIAAQQSSWLVQSHVGEMKNMFQGWLRNPPR